MDALFLGGDVATEKGEDKSNDDAGQHKQQQHRHIRVLQEVAVKKICAVEIQKDLVLQRRLTACCDVYHMLETVVQIIVVAEGTKTAELGRFPAHTISLCLYVSVSLSHSSKNGHNHWYVHELGYLFLSINVATENTQEH